MRVLGIDPGYSVTGYAVVERTGGALSAVSVGAIRTSASEPPSGRLRQLRLALLEVIERDAPEVTALEKVFFNSNVRTAMAVGQASGVAMEAAASSGLEVFDYTPTEVKSSVAGFGGASKAQVQAMVAALLHLDAPPKPPDAADACALAICHLNRSGLRSALAKAAAR